MMADDKTTKPITNANCIFNTYSYGIVYTYTIPDKSHKGRVKIGAATYNGTIKDPLHPTSGEQKEIDIAAKKRIDKQTKTPDIKYHLENAYISITKNGEFFNDYTVHNILKRSGYERKSTNTKNEHSEWFEISPALAKEAILAAIDGKKALSSTQINAASKIDQIDLRPSQMDAIERTIKAISNGRKSYLWNAKMRFGKTIAAMYVAKESNALNPEQFKKVLIVTHRPNVNIDWFTDFKKVFCEDNTEWEFSSRDKGDSLKSRLEKDKPFIYFASLQDLRLSKTVVSDRKASHSQAKGFKKNEDVFSTEWDMMIVDEAHEGTQSALGDATFSKINRKFTLQLSGTPFNILHKFEDNEIYTWDYIMEQDEKIHWDEKHPGKPNPYAELPSLSMLTYEIDKYLGGKDLPQEFTDAIDGAFNFHEMFRVEKDEDGNDLPVFVHSEMVDKFLNLLVDTKHNFPYSTEEYRNYNKHSMWLLPNRTKIIEAMEKKLKNHPVFGNFGIVNISGNMTSDDEQDTDAKKRVENAIKENDYTITLTGQRLTVGASIKRWTAVLMMSDTDRAATYLQAAFRCQTPAVVDGKLKTHGYVFDFAPDRTLKLVAEAVEVNRKRTTSPEQKEAMRKFLNFCPIIAATDGNMKKFSVSTMLEQLKNAIVERVRRNGFDDPKLYNDKLLKLTEVEINSFNDLRAIVGTSTKENLNEIPVNGIGLTEKEIEKGEGGERGPKKELTEEEKEALRKLKEAREQRKKAISILRGISIRMPMLVYGAINDIDGTPLKFNEDISLEKFVRLVDDESWAEFMPDGLTKDRFKEFIKYYDEDVFRGVTKSIRAKAHDCDELLPYDRIQAIAEIFSTFKNPDKETVLTPWKVVNMHISSTLGGYDFNNTSNELEGLPEYVKHKPYSNIWNSNDTTILEINSKSGLYPLLATYNLYQSRLPEYLKHNKRKKDDCFRELWNEILEKQIFVLCKTPMAKTITERTLAGYTNAKVNVVYIHDLVRKLRKIKDSKVDYSNYSLKDELYKLFNMKGDDMRFTAVVGNPPYQGDNHFQIYPDFYLAAQELGDTVSLIFPTGWQEPKNANNLSKLNKKEIKEDRQIIFIDNRHNVFPGIPGAEWTNIILWKKNFDNKLGGKQRILTNGKNETTRKLSYVKDQIEKPKEIVNFAKHIESSPTFKSISKITTSRKPFGLTTDCIKTPGKYGMTYKKEKSDDIKIFAKQGVIFYVSRDYSFTKQTGHLSKYKVFVPYAWGNMSEKSGLGGAFANIIIAKPYEACTETYIESGNFDDYDRAKKHAKYLMTRFTRGLLYMNKTTQHSTTAWGSIPIQNYSEPWWDKSINEIDDELFKKYKVPDNIKQFVYDNIQQRSEANIINYE